MTQADDQRSQAEEIFDQWVVEHEDSEDLDRERLLESCPNLRKELETLLEEYYLAEQSLKEGGAGEKGGGEERRRLGDFELLTEVGRGGMGVVYEALQLSLNRTVALKVLPRTLSLSDSAVTRFKREASIIAGLQHPNIVPVYAVGEEQGTHFFAMELVDGVSLDKIVSALKGRRARELTTSDLTEVLESSDGTDPSKPVGGPRSWVRAVVEFSAQVAEALQFAHDAGVLHRDVKPANILLRRDGTALLTDFGLSRTSDGPSMTQTGQFQGTPYYVSPEQAMSGRVRTDARSDIYSLGITLFELLTLRRPFEGSSAVEVFGNIVSKPPPNPSQLNASLPEDLVNVVLKAIDRDPDRRYASATEFSQDLRAFLEYRAVRARRVPLRVTVMRWAQREPFRAGLTVVGTVALIVISLLYADILDKSRELEKQTTSLAEQAQALEGSNTDLELERSRLAQANEDLQASGVELGAANEALQRRGTQLASANESLEQRTEEAENARASAESSLDRLQRVLEFQQAVINGVEPEPMGVGLMTLIQEQLESKMEQRELPDERRLHLTRALEEVRAYVNPADLARGLLDRHLLARTRKTIREDFGDDLVVEAGLHDALAETYLGLGLSETALDEARQAWTLRNRELGPDHPDTLSSLLRVAAAEQSMGRSEEGHRRAAEVLEARRRVLGPESGDTLVAAKIFATGLENRGQTEEAENLLREILEIQTKGGGRADYATLRTLWQLGEVLVRRGRWEEAEECLLESLRGHKALFGDQDRRTATAMIALAGLHQELGRLEEAESYLLQALAIQERRLGSNHYLTRHTEGILGTLYYSQGRMSDAEPLMRASMEKSRRAYGGLHESTLVDIENYASLLSSQGRIEEALGYMKEALDGKRLTLGARHELTLSSLANMGALLSYLKRYDEAEELLAEALAGYRELNVEAQPSAVAALLNLGATVRFQGRLEEAAALSKECVALSRQVLGDDHPRTIHALSQYGVVLDKLGDHGAALELTTEAVERARRVLPTESTYLASYLRDLAGPREHVGQHLEAAAALEESFSIYARQLQAGSRRLLDIAGSLARIYSGLDEEQPGNGHAEQAQRWRELAGSDADGGE